MTNRGLVAHLTDLDPAVRSRAVSHLAAMPAKETRDFAAYLGQQLRSDEGQSRAVWSIWNLVRCWRADVQANQDSGRGVAELAWPVIRTVRAKCLPTLLELRAAWFGWTPWDDCEMLAPLCAARLDQYFLVGMQIIDGHLEAGGLVRDDARRARVLFDRPVAHRSARDTPPQRVAGALLSGLRSRRHDTRLAGLGLLVALVFGVGCVTDLDEETRRHELAQSGPWEPPAETLVLADAYDLRFVSAGPWVGSSGCTGSFTPGGKVLREWLYAQWPQVSHVGGYSCRAINGNGSQMSVHATGRAVDIHIPLDDGQADNGLGDPLANWLLEHAEEIGIQSIIWDRWIWSPSRSPRSRPYTGAHPHHDHLHVELTPAAGRMETPWFQGGMGSPEVGGCDEAMPAEGGMIDDADTCFQAFGPAQYWRRAEGVGIGGSMRWTNAFKADAPSNWARWRFNLAEAGTYRIEVHTIAQYAVFESAQYRVRHGDAEQDVYVDLSVAAEWESLGEFALEAGEGQWVSLYDNAQLDTGSDQHIGADAIRLVRVLPGEQGNVEAPASVTATPPETEPTTPELGPAPNRGASNDAGGRLDGVSVQNGCSTQGADDPTWLGLAVLGLFWRRRRAATPRVPLVDGAGSVML